MYLWWWRLEADYRYQQNARKEETWILEFFVWIVGGGDRAARFAELAMSNFALGRMVRTLLVAVVGYFVAFTILARTGLVHTPDDLKTASVVVAGVLGLLAYRHT